MLWESFLLYLLLLKVILERTILFIFKSPLIFLTFVNYEAPYFAEGFLLNLRQCFDIGFVQLGVIPRTKNEFVEIVTVAECYLITNYVKVSKKYPFRICLPVKLADGRMSVKKEKNYLHLIYNIFSLGKTAGKPSRRLKKATTRCDQARRRIYDVLKTSDVPRLEDVQFTTPWRRLIYDVLKTSDL